MFYNFKKRLLVNFVKCKLKTNKQKKQERENHHLFIYPLRYKIQSESKTFTHCFSEHMALKQFTLH